jgi:hypothetical protein
MSSQPIEVDNGAQEPSHRAIDNGNPAIFKPRWLVLDDINVDLISLSTVIASISAIFLAGIPAQLAVTGMAAIILPLRLFFPRARPPHGLVLITGASSGIGAELAYVFAEKGHDLVLVGRNEGQLEAVRKNVKDKYDRHAHTVAIDLSLHGSAQTLYDQVTKEKGLTVDVLVNSAGLGGAGDPFEQPIELADRMTTLNCISLVQLTQLFGRDMIKQKYGWMLQISSVGGKPPFHLSSPFSRTNLTNVFNAY